MIALAPRLQKAYRVLAVNLHKYLRGFNLPDAPLFDEGGSRLFAESLARSSVFLEFGSGGSTIMACRQCRLMVSVETDRQFLRAIAAKIANSSPKSDYRLIHVNIGMTEAWGMPVFTRPSPRRTQRWKQYPDAPWPIFATLKEFPDLIVIDGRFRVACALRSFLAIPHSKSCTMLVDDYAENPHYRTIEAFGELKAMAGRMAMFCKRQDFDHAACERALGQAFKDYR